MATNMDSINKILSIQNLYSQTNDNPNISPNIQQLQSFFNHRLQQNQLNHQFHQLQHSTPLSPQQQQQQQQHLLQSNYQQQLQRHLNHQQQQIQHQSPHNLPNQRQQQRNVNSNNINNNHNSTNSIATNGRQNSHAPKKELIDLITCKLCKGYLIDATTLDSCMHSFCKPCAVNYIKNEHRCPECNTEIIEKRKLKRLKTDVTIQNIVYKLVPGLYEREMKRRRDFYDARPTDIPRYPSEMFGDIPPSKSIRPDDMMNVCLTLYTKDCPEKPIKTYIHCRADSTMLVLKKLAIGKFGLDRSIKIYYGKNSESLEIFFDLTTLMDVAVTFNWPPENKPNVKPEERILNLIIKEVVEEKNGLNSSHPMNSDHEL